MEESSNSKTSDRRDPVLLAVLAHPDDESFGIGGTLALYAARGVQTHLICATHGDVGTVSSEFLAVHNSVAELRIERELQCAAEKLGLSGVEVLDYRDSGMPGSPDNDHPRALINAPIDQVAAEVTHCIRMLRPHVVITHDPIGGYKHPDHIAVHKATVRAFHAANDPTHFPDDLPPYQPQKLYYQTFPTGILRALVRLLPLLRINPRQWGRNKDIDLTALVAEEPFPIHAVIDYRSVADCKIQASDCHASQLESGPPRGRFINILWRLIGSKEQFMRAYPPANPNLREKDLFTGLDF